MGILNYKMWFILDKCSLLMRDLKFVEKICYFENCENLGKKYINWYLFGDLKILGSY